jgi:hypothetical protein
MAECMNVANCQLDTIPSEVFVMVGGISPKEVTTSVGSICMNAFKPGDTRCPVGETANTPREMEDELLHETEEFLQFMGEKF